MSEYIGSLPVAESVTTPNDMPIRQGVKAIISSSDRVLLLKERHTGGGEFWTLPGGGVRPREFPVDGLQRELREELDCESTVEGKISSFWYAHQSPPPRVSVYTVFSCSVTSDLRPNRREGVIETRWVDPERPPPGTLLGVRRVLRDQIPR